MEIYCKRIRDLREDHDITQTQIANILNVTQTNYSKYERDDTKLTIEQLKILCLLYEINADYIIGLIETPRSYKNKP